ncbi:MAG: GntR family transcriptional regulator [Galactobacillus timonensis]|uniref:GntR family transcriptional regulator n=1 Tax=Galactobacillus timonensis TaxID=2041840 RepID=UPI00240A4623|nr:GntR family transcriptional regulator [Galactobacillus timonensis]MDD6600401.1 GntR family transcriptional regulator [Galactobacillus timonensis]
MPNEQPLYQQLADNIRSKIASGEYKVGDKIMSERKMAEIYDLNRLTVRKALDVLIQEGSLSAIRGSGTYVKAIVPANKKVHFGNDESISLSTVLRQSGFQSSRKVLSFRRIKTSGALKDYFPETEDVYELIRLSSIDQKPYALQICSFPANIFQQPERFDFAQESLYTYMELQGHYPKTVIADMWLTPIPNEYLDILKMDPGKLVFYYEYFGFDQNHAMVEFTKSYYDPTYTSFHYTAQKPVQI